jgi:xylan 1,4-beta-xylosidase
MINIARSPTPWGPFEPCPHNPILTNRARAMSVAQCIGHGDLVETHEGKWWMVFLGIRQKPGFFPRVHNLGRETFLAPVHWDNHGWPVVNGDGTLPELEIDADCPASVPVNREPSRDHFDSPKLRFCWNFLRNPYPEDWSLGERPGWLTLKGSGITLNEEDSPAFIGRRQQHDECEVSTLMDFEPLANDEAGLTVFMNPRHHYEIAARHSEGKKELIVRQTIGDLFKLVHSEIISPGPLRLLIQANQEFYHFSFVVGDQPLKTVAVGAARYLSTEVATGYTGVYFAMYATGNGQKSQAPAHFDWLDYSLDIT